MSDAHLTLVSHHLCPYVQRAAIALAEKGVPFERRYIDLSAKPDWFLAISPLGKVPLLVVNQADGTQAVLFESAVICEYLEETQPGSTLHPADPLKRARHRGWMEFGSSILSDLWGFETARDAVYYPVIFSYNFSVPLPINFEGHVDPPLLPKQAIDFRVPCSEFVRKLACEC